MHIHLGTFCEDGTFTLPKKHELQTQGQLTVIQYSLPATGMVSFSYSVSSHINKYVYGIINFCRTLQQHKMYAPLSDAEFPVLKNKHLIVQSFFTYDSHRECVLFPIENKVVQRSGKMSPTLYKPSMQVFPVGKQCSDINTGGTYITVQDSYAKGYPPILVHCKDKHVVSRVMKSVEITFTPGSNWHVSFAHIKLSKISTYTCVNIPLVDLTGQLDVQSIYNTSILQPLTVDMIAHCNTLVVDKPGYTVLNYTQHRHWCYADNRCCINHRIGRTAVLSFTINENSSHSNSFAVHWSLTYDHMTFIEEDLSLNVPAKLAIELTHSAYFIQVHIKTTKHYKNGDKLYLASDYFSDDLQSLWQSCQQSHKAPKIPCTPTHQK